MQGATHLTKSWKQSDAKFQSTPPMQGATRHGVSPSQFLCVSIHAPYAGSDAYGLFYCPKKAQFQSTPPMQGATQRKSFIIWIIKVSIHAPYAGSDVLSSHALAVSPQFQSTPPMQGATHSRSRADFRLGCFNPRPLCRERPRCLYADSRS